jgi:hypothetical protein
MNRKLVMISAAAGFLFAVPPAVCAQEAEAPTVAHVSPLAPPVVTGQSGTSQGGSGQSGASRFSERFTGYERNGPDREDRTHINVGDKHVNAIFGGLGQGGGVPFGIQLTTADDIPGVEFSGSAIVSTNASSAAV